MKRRNFLGALTAVVGAGPKAVAKAAAPATMEALSLTGISAMGEEVQSVPFREDKTYAQNALAKLLGKSKQQHERERKNYHIYSLDPDTAGLRSVSLGSKIRMSRRIQYAQGLRREEYHLTAIVRGWLD